MSKVKITDLPDATLPLSSTDLITATSAGTSSSIPFSLLSSSTGLFDGAYYGSVYTAGWDLWNVTQKGTFIYGTTQTPIDYAIVKLTTSGTIVWARKLTPEAGNYYYPIRLTVDASGNVFVTGEYIIGVSNVKSISVAKYNSSGVIQWQRFLSYGLTDNLDPASITTDSAESVIVGIREGYTSTIVKYNASGAIQWQSHLSKTVGSVVVNRLTTDSQNNVFVIGGTGDNGYIETILLKYNSAGVLQWSTTLDIGESAHVYDSRLVIDSADNVICSIKNDYSTKTFIAKYSNEGVQSWARLLTEEDVNSLTLLNDNIIAVSQILSGAGLLHIISMSSAGAVTDLKEIYVNTSDNPWCTGVTADSNYLYLGVSDN